MAQMVEADVSALRAAMTGPVVLPGGADYDTARSLWNGAHSRRPAVIARCASAQDVVAAIAFGQSQGLEIAVRGGGHNYAGFGACDDGLMIDLSQMRQVTVDPVAKRAVCGGGATLADLDAATQAHGLAVTGGTVSHTGVGGLTLGGGMGWLTRKMGLSCDNLVAAEVVTSDGRVLRASANEEPDLFWALRAGGGNFGVVTSFEFQLQEVGPLVQFGFFFWGQDKGAEALRFCRDFVATLPGDIGVAIVGMSAPPAPFVPEQYQGATGYTLILTGFGAPEDHQRAAEQVHAVMPPLFEFVTPIPYVQLQQLLDEGNPWGVYAYEKALVLDELSDEAIAVVTEHLPRKLSPLTIALVFVFGGAYARVDEDATAFGGNRKAFGAVVLDGLTLAPELFEGERAWVRAFYDALRPFGSAGGYVNTLAEDEGSRVRETYGDAKYDRLAKIKAAYDPDNIFHLNQNIKPA